MSASTAKATRRQIRRAVGSDALGVVNGLGLAVHTELSPRLTDCERSLTSHDHQLAQAWERMDRTDARVKAFQRMSFLARLRWVFTGQAPLV